MHKQFTRIPFHKLFNVQNIFLKKLVFLKQMFERFDKKDLCIHNLHCINSNHHIFQNVEIENKNQ